MSDIPISVAQEFARRMRALALDPETGNPLHCPPIPPRLRAKLMSSASHWFEELPKFSDYRWWALGRNLGLVV